MTTYGIINDPQVQAIARQQTRAEMVRMMSEYLAKSSGRQAEGVILIVDGDGYRRLRASDFKQAAVVEVEQVRKQHNTGPRNRWGALK